MDSDCLIWGEDVLASELEIPERVERADVSNLEIERAFFGFIIGAL